MTQDQLDRVFAALERAAVEGIRCPLNGTQGVDTIYTTKLARQGRIRVEISGHNYRTAVILSGPHAGKRTAPDPSGRKVWKIVDTNGSHMVEGVGAARRTPSAPRILDASWGGR